MKEVERFVPNVRIAYFSMEIALRSEVHTYSGGLGVLAGDTVRSAADLELPMVFVTLVSRAGYFRQVLDANGDQQEEPDSWDPAAWSVPVKAMIGVEIEQRDVWVRPWLYVHECAQGHDVPVLLLDTHVDQNDPRDRSITDQLYGGDEAYRLKQEIVLGIAGYRILRALGFNISRYHLNEGHAALLPMELLRRYQRPPSRTRSGRTYYDVHQVRDRCVFTTHTPVEAGHDKFPYDLVIRTTGDLLPMEELTALAGEDRLNMTRLALNLSGYVNGVAWAHATTTRAMFPEYDVKAVTNGVHAETWAHPAIAALLDARMPEWRFEPEILVRADSLPDDSVSAAHAEAKAALCRLVRDTTGTTMAEDVPILGFARRMTGYKRPDLLFHDIDAMARIAENQPFQVVLSGKAHPRDTNGKDIIRMIHEHAAQLEGKVPIAFLPNYDLDIAKVLVSGADVWLNTPLPPLEASGTSGMKAALNGVLNLSTLDGWWSEGCAEGVTGWAIENGGDHGAAAEALYRKLAEVVLPLYANDPARWTWMMKQAISKVASYFNSHRMMRRYAAEAYVR